MKEYKFRGKCIDSNLENEWVYGDLLQYNDGSVAIGTHGQYIDDGYHFNDMWDKCHYVYEETIGQYIGIKDKNGKEIYEGDIIFSEMRDGIAVLHKIDYDEDNAMFVAKAVMGVDFDYCYIRKDWVEKFGKEVIGNIYDNPELIANKE